MSEALARQLKARRIPVFSISPGLVRTALTEPYFSDDAPWTPAECAPRLVRRLATGPARRARRPLPPRGARRRRRPRAPRGRDRRERPERDPAAALVTSGTGLQSVGDPVAAEPCGCFALCTSIVAHPLDDGRCGVARADDALRPRSERRASRRRRKRQRPGRCRLERQGRRRVRRLRLRAPVERHLDDRVSRSPATSAEGNGAGRRDERSPARPSPSGAA